MKNPDDIGGGSALPDITEVIRRKALAARVIAANPSTANADTPVHPDFSRGLLTAPELLALDLKQRPRLLGQFLREGDLGYLFAQRGAGKSWHAMLIANAIAEGCALGEWEAGESPRPVFYFDAEMNLPDMQERVRKLGITSSCFHLLSNERLYNETGEGVNIASPLHQQAISEILPDGSLFILDNLSTSQRNMQEDKNDSFDLIKDWLLSLRHRHITVLIVHHAGRNGDHMRGGSRREDMAHWIIKLENQDEGGALTYITTFIKCRNCTPRDAPALRWALANTGETIAYTCEKYREQDIMLEYIRQGHDGCTELAEILECTKGTVSKKAAKLIQEGKLVLKGRKYVVVDPPPEGWSD
jgi:hypothetical protein